MYTPVIRVDRQQRNSIESVYLAGIQRCWTCGSCDFECPVNIFTGRLRPRSIMRMAALGMLPHLLELPDIWYCQRCLRCLRCANICPNTVSPAAVIDYVRTEEIRRGDISRGTAKKHYDLWMRFQRVRWQATAICLAGGELEDLSDSTWYRWIDTSIPADGRAITGRADSAVRSFTGKLTSAHQAQACFTRGECSSGCPASGSRNVFDPRALFRMVNLGLYQELLASPSLWLCLACRRCTACCSQKVDGAGLIAELQRIALKTGAVEECLPYTLEKANKLIYRRLLSEINQLLSITPANPEAR